MAPALQSLEALQLFEQELERHGRIFQRTFEDVRRTFGADWEHDFDCHLHHLLGLDAVAHRNAIRGYSRFAIEVMRLQQLFNRKRTYEPQSYQEAAERVYHNPAYMMDLYLPGIFLSHFLWRHHYRQLQYYRDTFLPLLDRQDDHRFYEVGIGTGFYTIQVLRRDARFHGHGVDISRHSRQFTLNHVRGWGFDDRFTAVDADILTATLEPLPFVQSIEVLEHLADPVAFIRGLRRLLLPGGHGFIAAALTAPQSDHIYLYWTPDDVIEHLRAGGFTVDDYLENPAYEGQPGEIVPKVAAFIVS